VPSLTAYAAVFAVAALTTFALTPVVRRLAIRFGAVVKPDERRVHEVPTPTLGGAAMLFGFLVGMLVAWRLDAFSPAFEGTTEPVGIVLAAVLIFLVGMIDDLREVSAPAKTAGTVLAASVLVLAGVSILQFKIPFDGLIFLSPDLSYLVSVIWVFLMVNAINLIDGLDGLAAGITAIAAGTFFLYGVQLSDEGLLLEGNIGPLIAVIVLGLCLGFLPHNFHPAKIFMGDAGALLLGLLMAASTMVVGGRKDLDFSGQTFFFFAPLVIPLFILGVPIVDTVFAIVRRATRRTGVATADKDHLHHRLMRLGHGQRRSVLILWAWTALLSGFVLFPTYTGKGDAIVPLGILALGLALYTMFHPGIRAARNRSDAAEAHEAHEAPETAESTTDAP
jgi:UDP-GlcNAc:undecaprenyl-phosphate GlcNAc-1-phosphate transferase